MHSVVPLKSCDYENIIPANAEKIVAIVPRVPIAALEYWDNRSTVRLDPEAPETPRTARRSLVEEIAYFSVVESVKSDLGSEAAHRAVEYIGAATR